MTQIQFALALANAFPPGYALLEVTPDEDLTKPPFINDDGDTVRHAGKYRRPDGTIRYFTLLEPVNEYTISNIVKIITG